MDISSIQESAHIGPEPPSASPVSDESRNSESIGNLEISLSRAHEAERDYTTSVMLNMYTDKGSLIDEIA